MWSVSLLTRDEHCCFYSFEFMLIGDVLWMHVTVLLNPWLFVEFFVLR